MPGLRPAALVAGCCLGRCPPGISASWSLDRDDIHWRDRGPGRQQVARGLVEGFGYLACGMRLPSLLGGEGVEDAVMGVVDPERIPRQGPLLGNRKLAAGLK